MGDVVGGAWEGRVLRPDGNAESLRALGLSSLCELWGSQWAQSLGRWFYAPAQGLSPPCPNGTSVSEDDTIRTLRLPKWQEIKQTFVAERTLFPLPSVPGLSQR